MGVSIPGIQPSYLCIGLKVRNCGGKIQISVIFCPPSIFPAKYCSEPTLIPSKLFYNCYVTLNKLFQIPFTSQLEANELDKNNKRVSSIF